MIAAIYARKSTEQNASPTRRSPSPARSSAPAPTPPRKGWTVAEEHIYVDDGISRRRVREAPGVPAADECAEAAARRSRCSSCPKSPGSAASRSRRPTRSSSSSRLACGSSTTSRTASARWTVRPRSSCSRRDLRRRDGAREGAASARRTRCAGRREPATWRAARCTATTTSSPSRPRHRGEAAPRRATHQRGRGRRRARDLRAGGGRLGLPPDRAHLNAEARSGPRPARAGRPRAWAPSTLYAMLTRPSTGEVTWNRTREAERWGVKHQPGRADEWIRSRFPHCGSSPSRSGRRSASDRGHARVVSAGHGRAALGPPRERHRVAVLLTGSAQCGLCGGSLVVHSRASGGRRANAYLCSYHHLRGSTVCPGGLVLPMDRTNEAVLDHRAGGPAPRGRPARAAPGPRRAERAHRHRGAPPDRPPGGTRRPGAGARPARRWRGSGWRPQAPPGWN